MNSQYFYFSFWFLVVSVILCAVWSFIIRAKHLTKKNVVNPINVFFVSSFLSLLILLIPKAYEQNGNYIIAFISSFRDSFNSMSFGTGLQTINSHIFADADDFLRDTEFLQRLYVCFLSSLIPLFSIRALFLLFKDSFTPLLCKLNIKSNLHVFSSINEKSLVIAKDIFSNNKNAKIVFCSSSKQGTENTHIDQARRINAWITKKSLLGIDLNNRFASGKAFLYFIDKDEKYNVRLALDVAKNIENIKRDINLLVFSSRESSEHVIDIANKKSQNKHVRIDLFNEARRTVYNLVYEHPIYSVGSENEPVNIMVLGAGSYGLEFAKAAAWCSQMISKKFVIRLFDKQNKENSIGFPFARLSKNLNKIGTSLDAAFVFCDVFSEEFESLCFENTDYAFIDLGEDDLNIKAALLVRMIYSRKASAMSDRNVHASMPKTVIRIRNAETKKIVEALDDTNIIPYGTFEDVFSGSSIYNWKIDRMAEFIHACYYYHIQTVSEISSDANAYELIKAGMIDYRKQTELFKRSSRATAIHSKYKFFDMGIGVDRQKLFSQEYDNIFNTFKEQLLRIEHHRWNTFQMLDGWAPWEKKDFIKNTHKNNNAKLHAYLAPFDELKSIAETIYGGKIDPTEHDRIIIESMRFAYLIGEYNEPADVVIKKYLQSI